MKLIIGNKNYSSWSFRPWIAMKVAGIAFEERLISLSDPEFKRAIAPVSQNGRVPAIDDDGVHVWESLAILEYLAEKFPEAGLWPADPHARAHARVVANEMHAGFQALRKNCPMNMWLPPKARPQSDEVMENVHRVDALWSDCRARFGEKAGRAGPFLFGAFGAADAMYAPVVARLHNYGLAVGPVSRDYMQAMMALPAWRAWYDAALQETWVMHHNEP